MSDVSARRVPIDRLSPDTRRDMLRLMRRYYLGVRAADFHRDLAAKDCVLLLENPRGQCVGFSTQAVFEESCGGRGARIVFSGDTVIDRAYRRSWVLPLAWGAWMEELRRADARPLYWLLISKGYRTYRYLPVFFHRFLPRDPPSPAERALLHQAARRVGGDRFDPARGIIRAAAVGQRLRADVAPVTEGRRRDPDIAFFERVNPGHAQGDELVCLAHWRPGNVRRHLWSRLAAAEPPPPRPPAPAAAGRRAAYARWARGCRDDDRRFRAALADARAAQEQRLRALLRTNAGTAFGRAHGFRRCRTADDYRAAVPPRRYDELRPWLERVFAGEPRILTRAPVQRLLPTSGSDGGTKWIPWTRPLKREFLAGIRPWIASLFRQWPAIRAGRMYWCLTPPVRRAPPGGAWPAGFGADSDYLDAAGRSAFARVSVGPSPEGIGDAGLEAWLDATAAALLEADDLAFVSVWSPTWLLGLLERIARDPERLLRRLPDRARARRIERALQGDAAGRWAAAWPRLVVVSCWADAAAAPAAAALARALPQAHLQPKGLLATEGIVTIPGRAGADPVPALAGHYLEFIDDAGVAHGVHELETGAEYAVLLTTGGGLYRYRLGDRVRVGDRPGGVPTMRFVGREGRCVDLVGEKLNEAWVLACLREAMGPGFASGSFALLAPRPDRPGYDLRVQAETLPGDAAARLDRALRRSCHYDLARRAGQLAPVRVIRLSADVDAAGIYARELRRRGLRDGDIKPAALDASPGWAEAFGNETPGTGKRKPVHPDR